MPRSGNPRKAPQSGTRFAEVHRQTRETEVRVALTLDVVGEPSCKIATGVGFFDHMLEQLSRHGHMNLELEATGDREVDDHHLIEDCGIVLGQALKKALGDKRGVRRYGLAYLPMDEALVRAVLDLSNRAYLSFNLEFTAQKIGSFDCQLVREFFQAFSANAGMTLHIDGLKGANAHHQAEAAFKAVARALAEAKTLDPNLKKSLPSTKGALS